MIVTITKGSHARNVHIPASDGTPRQFAHNWDSSDPEGMNRQAQNFINYAIALGGYVAPIVLLAPAATDDAVEDQHVKVELSDWAGVVETALGMTVEIK